MKFSRSWAMPSRHTFEIAPIRAFIERHAHGVIVDPFCGRSTIAGHRNDLGAGGVDAEEFCIGLFHKGVIADTVLFDPPYSPRQISECYKSIGLKVGIEETQNGRLYKRVREALAKLLRPGGKALSLGWNSAGFGWEIDEILLVAHGGAHNDTICVAETKTADQPNLFDAIGGKS